MNRSIRTDFLGVIYHVINRGNNKNTLFFDDKDYNVFLKQLREVKKEHDFSLYCYCIMPNHFHFLIETTETPLPKIMHKLLTSYAIYFNSRYEKTGHVFQGRYKAMICENEQYLFKLVSYIHLNPLKANVANNINDYRWGSHLHYSGAVENKLLSPDKLFLRMGYQSLEKGYKGYSLAFEEFSRNNYQRYSAKYFYKISLMDLLKEVASAAKTSETAVISANKDRSANNARKIFTHKAVKNYGYSLNDVAAFINRDKSAVSRYLKSQL